MPLRAVWSPLSTLLKHQSWYQTVQQEAKPYKCAAVFLMGKTEADTFGYNRGDERWMWFLWMYSQDFQIYAPGFWEERTAPLVHGSQKMNQLVWRKRPRGGHWVTWSPLSEWLGVHWGWQRWWDFSLAWKSSVWPLPHQKKARHVPRSWPAFDSIPVPTPTLVAHGGLWQAVNLCWMNRELLMTSFATQVLSLGNVRRGTFSSFCFQRRDAFWVKGSFKVW